MLNLPQLARRAEKLIADNSPAILTAIGVVGTVTTAYLTGKASFKAAAILAEESPNLRMREKVEIVWQVYIPPVVTGVLTISAIVLANRIGSRRAAAVAAAYAISEKAFEEYREKVTEKFGTKKEQAVRDEVNQDRMNRNPVSKNEVVIITGHVLCYDKFTGRYFSSDMESIRKAVNDINEQILHSHYASLGDFHEKLGLTPVSLSEEMGWNLDKSLDVTYGHALSDDNRPCLVIEYEVSPARNYFRMG